MHSKFSKLKITFFLIFIFLSSLCFLFKPSIAYEGEGVIKYNWLNWNIEDSNYNDAFRINSGGLDLIDYNNLGIYQQNEADNEVIFAMSVIWGAEAQYYTACTPTAIFPDINTRTGLNNYLYLLVQYRNWGVLYDDDRYRVSINSIDVGDQYLPNRYDPTIPITVGLNPDFDSLAGTQIGSTTIQSSSYSYEVKRVKVVDVDYGNVGEYETNFTLPTTSVHIDAVTQKGEPDSGYALEKVQNSNLGAEITDTFSTHVQSEEADTTTTGHIWTNNGEGSFSFLDWVVLKPRVELTQHRVATRYMNIEYNENSPFLPKTPSIKSGPTVIMSEPDGYRDHVTSGIDVDNFYIWKHYEIQMNILATVRLSAEEYQSSLDNAFFRQGDWVWDLELGGTTDLTLVKQESFTIFDFFGDLFSGVFGWFYTIIFIAIAVLIVYFVIRIILRRRRRRQQTVIVRERNSPYKSYK